MTSLFWRWTMTFIMAFVLSHNGGRALSFPYDDTGDWIYFVVQWKKN